MCPQNVVMLHVLLSVQGVSIAIALTVLLPTPVRMAAPGGRALAAGDHACAPTLVVAGVPISDVSMAVLIQLLSQQGRS